MIVPTNAIFYSMSNPKIKRLVLHWNRYIQCTHVVVIHIFYMHFKVITFLSYSRKNNKKSCLQIIIVNCDFIHIFFNHPSFSNSHLKQLQFLNSNNIISVDPQMNINYFYRPIKVLKFFENSGFLI
jgi:hypothetical protein